MRLFLAAVFLAGCAHQSEVHESSSVSTPPPSHEVIAVDQQTEEAPPQARPRLTRTVTLGQQNSDPTYEASPSPNAGPPQAGGNVTINNNVIVQQPPVYYGGWGWGGYGSYGGYGGGHRGSASSSSNGEFRRSTGGGGGSPPPVGGNWPTAPSYGPRSMK